MSAAAVAPRRDGGNGLDPDSITWWQPNRQCLPEDPIDAAPPPPDPDPNPVVVALSVNPANTMRVNWSGSAGTPNSTVFVDWGEGQEGNPVETVVLSAGGARLVDHLYAVAGTYTVTTSDETGELHQGDVTTEDPEA